MKKVTEAIEFTVFKRIE